MSKTERLVPSLNATPDQATGSPSPLEIRSVQFVHPLPVEGTAAVSWKGQSVLQNEIY